MGALNAAPSARGSAQSSVMPCDAVELVDLIIFALTVIIFVVCSFRSRFMRGLYSTVQGAAPERGAKSTHQSVFSIWGSA
jgi:hypothetical protein